MLREDSDLRRARHRDEALSQQNVSDLLDGVSLYELATSLYDTRMAEAARELGITVLAPA